jgi:hypothetical protein
MRVKYWEIIADNLSKAGWSWGCVATVDARGRTIFVADADRDDGKRFVVEIKAGQTVAHHVKTLLDYVIRRFNLPSAQLNKLQGLDLR